MADKHILVPIDFSNDSIRALDYAFGIAKILKNRVKLIHVKRQNADYDASFNLDDFDEVLQNKVEDNFSRLIGKMQIKYKTEIDYSIRQGRIYNEICNQAKYGDSNLIVMGTHGVSGFEERWVGSNAYRVVSHSPCPVITVRNNFPMRPIKKIVLPIDKSEHSRLKVPFVVNLAVKLKAELNVIAIRENERSSTLKKIDEYMNQVKVYIKRRNIKCIYDSLKGKNLADVCIEYALLNDADIIAIMTEQPDNAKSFWLGQYAQQMVNHSPVPVLSFRVP